MSEIFDIDNQADNARESNSRLKSWLDENKAVLPKESHEQAVSELEEAENKLEQGEVLAANQQLIKVKGELEQALRLAGDNSGAKAEVEAALQSLSSITINSGKDAKAASSAVATAQQSAAAAEGKAMQQAVGGAALSIAGSVSGIAALLSSPENKENLAKFKECVGGYCADSDFNTITSNLFNTAQNKQKIPNITVA